MGNFLIKTAEEFFYTLMDEDKRGEFFVSAAAGMVFAIRAILYFLNKKFKLRELNSILV
jgi:hypothetical protein